MVRIAISVEGRTEQRFVEMVLEPFFQSKNIFLTPILFNREGGGIKLSKIKSEIERLALSFDYITTLYDFYGFYGKEINETKSSLEQKIFNELSNSTKAKFIPYIQMYEFEGILFSSPESIANVISINLKEKNQLEEILKEFNGNPEKINSSKETAPSKRLEKYNYIKTVHGPKIAKEIGLEQIRNKCQGFNQWLSKIEEIAKKD